MNRISQKIEELISGGEEGRGYAYGGGGLLLVIVIVILLVWLL
ncbi:MAG: hypothetical protein ABI305_09300 [Tepidiformaceae bacterium]